MARLLIANRGEIAVRIARAAAAEGWASVAVTAADEPDAPHVAAADEAHVLLGSGPAAYLDPAAIVEAALATDCAFVHPGYGFLSETPDLTRACADAGVTVVGPAPEDLAVLGDKALIGANLSVPIGTVVLRKAYGLGAQAMAGGSTKVPRFTVGWPTSEFGPMGLEGAVRLGMRRELAAIEDDAERQAAYEAAVAAAYEKGRGLNVAAHWEIDDVIDPADTRRWIATLTREVAATPRPAGRVRPHVDTW